MHQHIRKRRLLEVADKQMRLTEPEFDHLEKCIECQTLYAKSILELACARAKDKRKKPPSLSV